MKPKVLVAPSLLAANPLRFEEELKSAEATGVDFHHVDVMDGHFVPNLSYGLPLVRAIKAISLVPLDVHIMVSNPDLVAMDYVAAGADILVFPLESAVHTHRLIHAIKEKGARAGVAINPGTSIFALEALLPYVDVVNVMSVNPGFGGQSFIPESIGRISRIRSMLRELGRESEVIIEVDGGINAQTAPLVIEAGAQMLVAGTYFYGASSRAEALRVLRG